MSSFAAFLHVQGVRYPLLTYSLAIHQQTDSLGRPASPTHGGIIDCTLNVPTADRSGLVQWMFSPTAQLDGQLVLMQDVPRTTLKTISFFNAYCVGLQMHFQPGAGGGGSLQLQLRISPQRVAVGAILHDNNWPVESHGAGESHGRQNSLVQPGKAPKVSSEAMHEALDWAGWVPGLNIPTALADTALYLKEGNLTGAALSAVAILPLGKALVKGVKLIRRVRKARKLLKNVLGLRALGKRLANRAQAVINKTIVKAVRQVKQSKWGRRVARNVLALRNLKKRVANRVAKTVDKGLDKALKLVRHTKLGRRLTRNAKFIAALRARVQKNTGKLLDKGIKKAVKRVRQTSLAKRLVKNVAALEALKERVVSRAKKVADGVGRGIERIADQWQRRLEKKLMRELERDGIKFSADKLVRIARNLEGKIIFLEKGNSKAGLEHILRHAGDFEAKGVARHEIADVVMKAVTGGKAVAMQGTRPVYEVMHKGKKMLVAVTTGKNGFIVGANPTSLP